MSFVLEIAVIRACVMFLHPSVPVIWTKVPTHCIASTDYGSKLGGQDCSIALCEAHDKCSNRGTCQSDHTCLCDEGFYGDNCSRGMLMDMHLHLCCS